MKSKPRGPSLSAKICGPFLPALGFVTVLLGMFSLMRLIQVLIHWGRVSSTPSALWLLLIGIRFDLLTTAYLLIVPLVLLVSLNDPRSGWTRAVLVAVLTTTTLAALFMEVASIPFIGEFDLRPNRLFFEQLPKFDEVARTILAEYGFALALTIAVLVASAILTARWYWSLCSRSRPWGRLTRLAWSVPLVMLLFLAARGSVSHRAINISTAAFTNNQLVNQLALNSAYSLAYSIYNMRHEEDASQVYGQSMAPEEIIRIVRSTIGLDETGGSADSPLLHRQVPRRSPGTRPNLVIVLEESLGAEFVEILGGLPLTPRFDELSQEGMLLTQLYSTGTRTVRAIEAVVSGFPPSPGRSVVKLSLSQNGFFTLGELLQDAGYETEFIYGGESRFDNMGSFFAGNGFQKVYEQPDFDDPKFLGTWGVCDEDLFDKAHEIFLAHGDRPFFAVLLSTSNHSPFEFPDETIELYEEPKNTRHNAAKYADYALGKFFDKAKTASYYANTVFVVVADHSIRTYGDDLVPVEKFRMPGLIIGPGVPLARFDEIASHLDVGPTVIDLLGLHAVHPMIGQSLLGPPAKARRAILQFSTSNAYVQGDQVVVHMPKSEALQFRYSDNRLVPVDVDPELARVALAHALLPSLLYANRTYRGSSTAATSHARAGIPAVAPSQPASHSPRPRESVHR